MSSRKCGKQRDGYALLGTPPLLKVNLKFIIVPPIVLNNLCIIGFVDIEEIKDYVRISLCDGFSHLATERKKESWNDLVNR
ncbi:hypothetical protein OUZ56_009045 [Daphnia magna]|uniref:Uncharacterized protein n=1 Tax=Daphnia magna TaxID=35525 RepID=A0ABR0AET5_9CRUS|nr:hypothetical protein OUZ56_009045 [Daphnia magna]